MAINQTFIDFVTPIPADWLNNVNTAVNTTIPGQAASIATLTKKTFVSVLDYGAKSDGVTDDTAAVQAAITAIGSSESYLYFTGPTKVSSNLTFGLETFLTFVPGAYLLGTTGTEVMTVQSYPVAGPWQIFKNCVPVATSGIDTWVEWFGAEGDGVTNDAAAFNAAFAFLKNTGGTIRMRPVTYSISATIVNNWSHIALYGAGLNNTYINMTSPTLDAIQNFGVAGTPLANCVFKDFSILCTAVGSSTGSFGINLQYNAFTRLENIQVQEFLFGVNLLRATNTQIIQVGSTYVAGSTNGFIGFNFNGGGTGTGGNASTTLRNCFASGNNTLTGSIGYKLSGVYMSDLFWENCETAGTNYGYYFDYSTATFFEDVIISRPICDQWTAQGIFVYNMPVGGKLTIMGGWINPKNGANNNTTCVYISGCAGNITVNGTQIVADANIANTTGVQIINSSGVALCGGTQITNTHIGVNMSGSGYNVISAQFKNDATAAAYFISGTGDARTMVTGCTFSGFATIGVAFDATSSGSAVVANTFRITNIGTRVANNATAPVGSSDGSTGLNTGY